MITVRRDLWERIEMRGWILVASRTSPPPFAYTNSRRLHMRENLIELYFKQQDIPMEYQGHKLWKGVEHTAWSRLCLDNDRYSIYTVWDMTLHYREEMMSNKTAMRTHFYGEWEIGGRL